MASVIWNSPDGPRTYRLGAETRIGRAPDNDICIPDSGVSGIHARIVREGNAWVLEDLQSRNGTFVNDEQIERATLADGDLIGIGKVDLKFSAPPERGGYANDLVADASTIVWRKGDAAGQPVASGAATSTEGSPTSLGRIMRKDVDYNAVGQVDPMMFTTVQPSLSSEDPAHLSRRLMVAYEISQATDGTLSTPEVLDRVLGALFGMFRTADRAFIVLVDPKTREVHTAAAKSRVKGRAAEAGISQTALDRAMETRTALLCRDAAADERFAQAQSIFQLGIRSMMIAPIVFRDEVLGAVHVDTLRGMQSFTEADLELLSLAANQVAGCLANARLHEKVVAAERLAAVGQTLAGLTHCIKNILQGIKGGAFILDKGIDKGDIGRVKTGWEMVKRNNQFMEELVYDLLTYSKKRQPDYAEDDLNELCADICELSAERAKAKGVTLEFRPDKSLGPVEIDSRGIRRCVLNLVGNAVDACAENNGTVTVETKAPGDDKMARVIVTDTGCGMSRETLAKLFTVFFSTKGSKGTGLGLPVTQKIIEEHGGRIDVESQEGKGTTFTICLPPRRQDTAKL